MVFRAVAFAIGMNLALTAAAVAQDDGASQARQVLKTHCGGCHDRQQTDNGGFDYLLDRDALVSRKKVVPGQPAASELMQRIHKNEMPPAKVAKRPTQDELAVLEKWVKAGAPRWDRPVAGLSRSETYRLIAADIQGTPECERRFMRYLTLGHLAAAGWSAEEIDTCRRGLAKLLNSLSWHPRLTHPKAIDAGATIYRLDLRDIKWSERLWDRVAAQYPYTLDAVSRPSMVLRADWFIATASSAALYYELLQVPSADRSLERLLQVDVLANIEDGSVRRAGFTDSGVSKNNRLIERHDAGFGAYWRSYDFAASTERQNLLNHPLGPPPARDSFVHAGGEMIFHLPNGILAFFVTDAAGKRIERAPVEIVSDPGRPEKIVEAGISCFNCHAKGFIPKADMVRAHVQKNAQAFAKADVESIQAIYRPDAELRKLLDLDNDRYHAALGKLGIKPEDADPINRVRNRYEGLVDQKTAAAELGLEPTQLAARLKQSEALQRSLGALLADGGTVQRTTFLAALRELIDLPATVTPARQAFAGHTDRVLCLAFAPDGQRAASGSADRTIRVWDVATGLELQRLEHGGPVQTVAYSPDGKRLLSSSQDRSILLWDLESGKRLLSLKGHADAVSALAFSPHGRRAASGSADRTLRVWDLDQGKEIAQTTPVPGTIRAISFAPDGRSILGTAGDRTARLWDATTGQEIRRFQGHGGDVYAVAFAPDGGRIVTGSNDKSARVWDAATGKELLCLKGHANAVITVGFSPDGKQVFTGSSQYQQPDRTLRVWDAASGKEMVAIGGSERDEVRGSVFAADGKLALTIGIEPPIRLWKLAE